MVTLDIIVLCHRLILDLARMQDRDSVILHVLMNACPMIAAQIIVPMLHTELKSKESAARQQAVFALGRLYDRAAGALPELLDALINGSVPRSLAAWAIRNTGRSGQAALLTVTLSFFFFLFFCFFFSFCLYFCMSVDECVRVCVSFLARFPLSCVNVFCIGWFSHLHYHLPLPS